MKKVPIPLTQRLVDFARGPLVVLVWLGTAGLASWMLLDRPRGVDHVGWIPPVEFEVTSPGTGKLAALLVEPLQRVRRGELLGQLDAGPLEGRLATARAQVEELQARLTDAVTTTTAVAERASAQLARETESEHRDWESELRRYVIDETDLHLEVLELQVRIATDRVEIDRIDVRLRRATSLAEQDVGPEADAEDLTLRKQRIERRVTANEELLAALVVELDAASERRSAFRELAPESPGAVAAVAGFSALAAAVRVQALRVRELELERERLGFSAPIDGLVSRMLVGEGQAVLAGRPVLVVTGDRATEAVVYVDAAIGGRELVGRRVELRPAGAERAVIESRVETVGPTVELLPERLWPGPANPVYGLALRVPLGDVGQLLPGEVIGMRFLPAAN